MDVFNFYFDILFDCPVGERKANCPINDVIHLDFIDRFEWFISLSEEKRN